MLSLRSLGAGAGAGAGTAAGAATAVRLFSSRSAGDIFHQGAFESRINTIVNFLPGGFEYVVERFGKFHQVYQPALIPR